MSSTQTLARRMLQAVKRRMIVRLGMVSDQKFYLDSGIVEPRTDVERIAIHSGTVSVEYVLPVDGSRVQNQYRPRYVYGINDSVIDPFAGLVYDANGQYIAESSSWWQLRQFWDWPKPRIRVPSKSLSGEFILLPNNGYYHWLIEDLPVFLKSLSVAPSAKVIVPKSATLYVREVAELIENEILMLDSPVRVERLVMTGKTGGMGSPIVGLTPHPADVAVLRKFFNKYFEPPPYHRKLYLSRVGQSRSPANERDLEAEMRRMGYEHFDGTGMSLHSQIAVFSTASNLIGLHGAALSNVVWAPERIQVCEIFSSAYMPSCYSTLTAIRNGSYTPISYRAGEPTMIDTATMERVIATAYATVHQ